MSQPEIKAICFDMDGLLFNTEELFDEIGIEMLARRGKQLDHSLVQRMMGQQANVALQLFIDHYDLSDTIQDLKDESDELFDRILPERLQPMPGAIELLEWLEAHGKYPLALTTSSGAASVDRLMSFCDLSRFFEFRLTAEDIENSKPHPEIYLTAANRFAIAPNEMLVFEDSENGCKSGVRAKAHVIAVPSKHGHLHDFIGSLFVAESLDDERIGSFLASASALQSP